MRKKNHKITFSHKIGKSTNGVLVVYANAYVNSIQAMTFNGAKLPIEVKQRYWKLDWHFPFLHRRERVIAYKKI